MRDPVTEHVASYVARRDGYRCIAPFVDGRAGWCRDQYGNVITRWDERRMDRTKLEIHHVKGEGELAMGKRADSTPDHLLLLCKGHHQGAGVTGQGGSIWASKRENLQRQRRYLDQFRSDYPRSPISPGE